MPQNWLQTLQNNSHLVVVFAFVALSFLQWFFRKLREQQQINERKRAEQRRRDELLRTGRPGDVSVGASAGSPAVRDAILRERRAREIAIARQRQLEELRRSQATARAPQPAPAQARPKLQRLPSAGPASSGTIVPPAPRPPARAGATKRAKQANQPAQSRPRQDPTKRPLKASLPVTTWESSDGEREAARAQPPAGASPKRTARVGEDPTRRQANTAEQWRRAIVLLEALAPPVSMRDPLSSSDRAF